MVGVAPPPVLFDRQRTYVGDQRARIHFQSAAPSKPVRHATISTTIRFKQLRRRKGPAPQSFYAKGEKRQYLVTIGGW
jgi:hypothetical protein